MALPNDMTEAKNVRNKRFSACLFGDYNGRNFRCKKLISKKGCSHHHICLKTNPKKTSTFCQNGLKYVPCWVYPMSHSQD